MKNPAILIERKAMTIMYTKKLSGVQSGHQYELPSQWARSPLIGPAGQCRADDTLLRHMMDECISKTFIQQLITALTYYMYKECCVWQAVQGLSLCKSIDT